MLSLAESATKLTLKGDGKEISRLARKLRFRPAGFQYSPRYQLFDATDGREGWDGYLSVIQTYDNDGRPLGRCLRGHKDQVIELCDQLGIQLDTSKTLRSPFRGLLPDDLPDDLVESAHALDEWQREGVAYWLSHGMGVNKMAVNAGKTLAFAAAASMILRRYAEDAIIYITQSERLCTQTFNELTRLLPEYKVSRFGAGSHDHTGSIVVCTAAMLWRHRLDLKRQRVFERFIGVFYDESHHAHSKTSELILLNIPAFFRFGASDSVHEADEAKAVKIRGLLGPLRMQVDIGAYIAIGRTAKPNLYLIENRSWRGKFAGVPFRPEAGTDAWALIGPDWKRGVYVGPVYQRDDKGEIVMRKKKVLVGVDYVNEYDPDSQQVQQVKTGQWKEVELPVTIDNCHHLLIDGEDYSVDSRYCLLERLTDRAIVRFTERNKLIVEWAKYYTQEHKFPTLVVCTRTLHVLILEAMIKQAVGDKQVEILYSDHSRKERDDVFAWLKNTPGSVLISPLVKEGVSINEIRAGIIADHVADHEVMKQIIGRHVRKKEQDNTAHISIFMDVQHSVLRRGCRKVYEKLRDVRGFTFFHPVIHPKDIKTANKYQAEDS